MIAIGTKGTPTKTWEHAQLVNLATEINIAKRKRAAREKIARVKASAEKAKGERIAAERAAMEKTWKLKAWTTVFRQRSSFEGVVICAVLMLFHFLFIGFL